MWHLDIPSVCPVPPLSCSGPGGNNAPIEAHNPRDNISVSPGKGAKQVSLVGAGSLLYSKTGKTSGMEQEVRRAQETCSCWGQSGGRG